MALVWGQVDRARSPVRFKFDRFGTHDLKMRPGAWRCHWYDPCCRGLDGKASWAGRGLMVLNTGGEK